MILLLIGLLVLAGVALLVLDGKRAAAWRTLENERESKAREREEIVFYLEMARALATGGKVYVVEAGDALAHETYWRRHTFFLNRDEAETYAESMSLWGGQLLAPFTRVREITPDDLPPTPYRVRPLKGQEHSERYATDSPERDPARPGSGEALEGAREPDPASRRSGARARVGVH